MKLKIHGTGGLTLDSNMIHPFVRIHVIDMDTYKYLAKTKPYEPGVTNKESATFIDSRNNIKRHTTDYLLPMSTSMFDMRIKGSNMAQWD